MKSKIIEIATSQTIHKVMTKEQYDFYSSTIENDTLSEKAIKENSDTVFALVTDLNYFNKARRTIIDLRNRGSWSGNVALITIGFDLHQTFKEKYNIIEVKFPLIDKTQLLEKIGPSGFKNSDKREINKLREDVEKLSKELEKYTPDITTVIQKKINNNYHICNTGYFLYAYECGNMRYKCSISRQKDIDHVINNLKCLEPNGDIKYKVSVKFPFIEKIMIFLLKKSMTLIGNNKFEGSYENIKLILDISSKIENILLENADDLEGLYNKLQGIDFKKENVLDPEIPITRKSKRPIDQIDKNTGEIINTYESIEAAGRSLGLTTGTAIGIALREKRICQGFIWRYSGISKEDQFTNQPVIKICCSNGEKTLFKTLAHAAGDAKISAPGLRTRILTNLHINGYHWIFDKSSSHYN
jgi:hypothetical protein